MSERQYDIAICRFPGDGWERHELTSWLIRTVCKMKKDPRIGTIHDIVEAGETPITIARNRAVKKAMALGASYILFVDNDMVPDLPGEQPFWDTAWEFMLARRDAEEQFKLDWVGDVEEIPSRFAPATIAAPYGGPPPYENVFVFEWKGFQSDCPDDQFKLEAFTREQAAARTGIEEVVALPTGLILYDSRVFEILPKPWFDYELEEDETEKHTTEDVYQTRNAHVLGLPQLVAWQCWSGHHKSKVVGRPQFVTKDSVHKSLVRAVERNLNRGERILIVDPKIHGVVDEGAASPAEAS